MQHPRLPHDESAPIVAVQLVWAQSPGNGKRQGRTGVMRRERPVLRRVVLALAGLEILAAAAVYALFIGSTDPLGAAIARAVIVLTAAPACLCALPALLLAWLGRLPFLALALAVAAPLFWLYLMARA